MAVPAHDERDWEFAKKYELSIICVISPNIPYMDVDKRDKILDDIINEKICSPYGGLTRNSGDFSGLYSEDAIKEFIKIAEKEGFGKKVVNYKLRDWIFSRQRYWGEPIPLIHIAKKDKDALPTIYTSECWMDKKILKK